MSQGEGNFAIKLLYLSPSLVSVPGMFSSHTVNKLESGGVLTAPHFPPSLSLFISLPFSIFPFLSLRKTCFERSIHEISQPQEEISMIESYLIELFS